MNIKNQDCIIELRKLNDNIIANILDSSIFLKHNGFSFTGIELGVEYFNKVKEILDRKHE